MASPKRQSFLFRADPKLMEALRRWADDDLRSVNAQIEFILRRALRESGRQSKRDREARDENEDAD